MHALGQLAANPRVAEYLDASEELLVSQASLLDFDDYVTLLAHWEALADADGAHGDHERAHTEIVRRTPQLLANASISTPMVAPRLVLH